MTGSHTLLLLLPTSLPSESTTQITNPFLFCSAERGALLCARMWQPTSQKLKLLSKDQLLGILPLSSLFIRSKFSPPIPHLSTEVLILPGSPNYLLNYQRSFQTVVTTFFPVKVQEPAWWGANHPGASLPWFV